MTRRCILFVDHEGRKLALTTQYNGDRTEFLAMGSQDSCDKEWHEIEREFLKCRTLAQFEATDRRCQGYYHSHLTAHLMTEYQPLTIMTTEDDLENPLCELYILMDGTLYSSETCEAQAAIRKAMDRVKDNGYLRLLLAYIHAL